MFLVILDHILQNNCKYLVICLTPVAYECCFFDSERVMFLLIFDHIFGSAANDPKVFENILTKQEKQKSPDFFAVFWALLDPCLIDC